MFPISLLCADWEDPRNVGAAFRLADAAGLSGLVLAGTTPAPPHAKIGKTARSTIRAVPYTIVDSATAYVEQAAASGYHIIALEVTTDSQSLFDFLPEPDQPILLIAGRESSGIAPELLERCHTSVHLPMYGQNTSMNVAVALGAAVYLLLMKLQ